MYTKLPAFPPDLHGENQNALVSNTTLFFGLASFLESVEDDFIKLSEIQTDNQMST